MYYLKNKSCAKKVFMTFVHLSHPITAKVAVMRRSPYFTFCSNIVIIFNDIDITI